MEKEFLTIKDSLVNKKEALTGPELLLLMSCNTNLKLIEYIKDTIGIEKISLAEQNKYLCQQVARLEDQLERIRIILCGP